MAHRLVPLVLATTALAGRAVWASDAEMNFLGDDRDRWCAELGAVGHVKAHDPSFATTWNLYVVDSNGGKQGERGYWTQRPNQPAGVISLFLGTGGKPLAEAGKPRKILDFAYDANTQAGRIALSPGGDRCLVARAPWGEKTPCTGHVFSTAAGREIGHFVLPAGHSMWAALFLTDHEHQDDLLVAEAWNGGGCLSLVDIPTGAVTTLADGTTSQGWACDQPPGRAEIWFSGIDTGEMVLDLTTKTLVTLVPREREPGKASVFTPMFTADGAVATVARWDPDQGGGRTAFFHVDVAKREVAPLPCSMVIRYGIDLVTISGELAYFRDFSWAAKGAEAELYSLDLAKGLIHKAKRSDIPSGRVAHGAAGGPIQAK